MTIRLLALAATLWPALVFGQVTIGPEGPVQAAPPPGQPPKPDPNEPQLIRLTISPAAEPVPALRYRFDVPVTEQKPGNSVPFYYRALAQLRQSANFQEQQRQFHAVYNEIQDLPLDKFPIEKAKETLAPYENIFMELERATVRSETDWDWRLEELSGPESISFLLPEIQDSRELARLLHLKGRVEIAEGRFEDAEQTLRMGYALAQAVAEPLTIINDLVGVAITSIMDVVVRDWIDAKGSPNVYWALAALPDPLIELRPALEYELAFPFRFAPWLGDVENDDVPPAVWRHRFTSLLQDVFGIAGSAGLGDLVQTEVTHLYLAGLSLRNYPLAKRDLIERGYDPARVEAMPVGQVLAIQQKYVDQVIAGELLKETLVDSPEAAMIGERAEQTLKERNLFGSPPSTGLAEPFPIMALLAPATRQALQAEVRSRTQHAGLRTIEAIRMHAAATGSLPNSLDEIEIVPVPDNPRTGEPFPYRLEDGKATLDIIANERVPRINWRVELTLEE